MQIEISDYTKKVKNNIILDNINIKMQSGMVYGLCGRNGCGKTMLMRAISGLILPTEGYVKIDNKIIGKDISFPQNTGLLLEYPGFIKKYTGFKNLKMIASLNKKVSDEQIKDIMLKTGLNPDDKKSFGRYSLGMKQKLGISCAMMENPELLILDEPVNALDESSVKNVYRLINEYSRNGVLVIISGHSKDILKNICDEIFYMDCGRIFNDEKIQKDSLV